jgi:hypothetical protein
LIVVLLPVLIAAGAAAWWMTHRHDSRIVGRWLLSDSPGPGDGIEWRFDADGTGRHGPGRSFVTFRWWTAGERLHLKWGASREGWGALKDTVDELWETLHGKSLEGRHEEFVYSAVTETAGGTPQFVLRALDGWHPPPDDVFYLTRIGER